MGHRTRRCTSRRAELKPLHDAPSFINVRAAGERRCSTDQHLRGNDSGTVSSFGASNPLAEVAACGYQKADSG